MKSRRLAIVALVVAAGLGLSGCVPFPGAFPGLPAAEDGGHHPGNGNGHGKGQGQDKDHGKGSEAGAGAAGLVMSVTGSTAKVQNAKRTTAVTWTASTRFTTEKTASSADLETGQCVIVQRTRPAGDTYEASPTPGAKTVDAASITMFASVNGSCAAGLSGMASAKANGMPRGGGAAGLVTSVSDGSIVVSQTRGNATRDVTVSYGPSTQFGSLQAGSASDVVVGVCLAAQGRRKADTLTATAIALTPGMGGGCGAPRVNPGPINPTPDQTSGR